MTKNELASLVSGMQQAEQSLRACRRGGAFRQQELELALRLLVATREQAQTILQAWGPQPPDEAA
jgi:hypothetical protein